MRVLVAVLLTSCVLLTVDARRRRPASCDMNEVCPPIADPCPTEATCPVGDRVLQTVRRHVTDAYVVIASALIGLHQRVLVELSKFFFERTKVNDSLMKDKIVRCTVHSIAFNRT